MKEGHVRALRAVADDADIVQDILTEVMEENGGKITAKAITAKIAQRRADDDRRAMLVALLGPGAGDTARRTSYWGIAPQWDDTELSLAYPSCMVADLMKAPR